MSNNRFKNPKYYFIDRNYLIDIFGEDFVDQAKYDRRPFVGFADSNILIAFPQRSIQPEKPHRFRYRYNLYLDKLNGEPKQRYLKLDDYLYVPESKRSVCYFNNDIIHKKHLLQISNNNKYINVILKEINERLEVEMGFSYSHQFISKSKRLCKHELEKDQKQNNGPELAM